MYKGVVATSTALTAETNIPFTLVRNTNCNTRTDSTSNTVIIRKTGYYRVTASLPVTGASSTPVTMQIFKNGVGIPEAICESTIVVTAGVQTLTAVDVIAASSGDTLSVQVSEALTMALPGLFIIERVK